MTRWQLELSIVDGIPSRGEDLLRGLKQHDCGVVLSAKGKGVVFMQEKIMTDLDLVTVHTEQQNS